ncbi:LysR family transcriptional regulator [bacterium]|nr:MAG: LysR family transcriptional regulator [bacterium]
MAVPRFDLNQLVALWHVVEARSFTQAAERAGMTHAALLQQIESLTRACGSPLVIEHGRAVEPTPLGQELARIGQRLRSEGEHAAKAAEDYLAGVGGRLTVGASLTAGALLAPHALAQLRHTHPALNISLQIGFSSDIIQAVVNELADLGIIEVPVQHPELTVSPFYRDVLRCVCSAQHPLAGQTVSVSALKNEPLIQREQGSGMREAIDTALRQAGLAFEHTIEIGSAEGIRAAVGVGLGITWVSALSQLDKKGLAVINVTDLAIERTISIIRRRGADPTPAMRAFMGALEHAALDIGENP